MKDSKLYKINFNLFIITSIILIFNAVFVINDEGLIDVLQVTFIAFLPVVIAFVLYNIKKMYNNPTIKIATMLFVFSANILTIFLYIFFALKTALFTTVEGFMSGEIYLLMLPIYSIPISIAVFILTIIIKLMYNFLSNKSQKT